MHCMYLNAIVPGLKNCVAKSKVMYCTNFCISLLIRWCILMIRLLLVFIICLMRACRCWLGSKNVSFFQVLVWIAMANPINMAYPINWEAWMAATCIWHSFNLLSLMVEVNRVTACSAALTLCFDTPLSSLAVRYTHILALQLLTATTPCACSKPCV